MILASLRILLHGLADLTRGLVRCAVPLGCVAVLVGLLASGQGRDVLVALADAADDEHGRSAAGLLFLGAGSAALSLSVWYTMRWLLACPASGLPLPRPPGRLQRALPRLVGAAVPALVAWFFWQIARKGGPPHARHAAWGFALLALLLGLAYQLRGPLLAWLEARGWEHVNDGRVGQQPRGLEDDEGLPPLTRRTIGWCLVLSALLMAMVIQFPVTLPRVLGAAALAGLALASINLVASFGLTYWPLRNGLPPLWPWVAVIAGLVFGATNDNHVVVPVVDRAPDPGPDVYQRFAEFLRPLQARGETEPVVLFVASEGGGIRAAYWTVAVLDALARRHAALDQRLFALSGVSGGSLGVAAWVASRREVYCPPPGVAIAGAASAPARAAGAVYDTPTPPTATQVLGADFIAPPVAGLLYYDFAQRFWPFAVSRWDRSRAVEAGWQRAFAYLPGRPFERPLDEMYAGCPRLPQLMLNSTVVETGQRAVIGSVHAASAPVFANTQPVTDSTARLQSLAGQVHHSARFPVVSPAGTIERIGANGVRQVAFRLVDGGYFDNSGLQSVMDLVAALKAAKFSFKPQVLVVRNDPVPMGVQPVRDTAPSGWFPEAGSVIGALYNARGSHAVTAQAEALLLWWPDQLVDLGVPRGTPAADAPLGWALSDGVRNNLRREAENVARAAAEKLERLRVPQQGVPE